MEAAATLKMFPENYITPRRCKDRTVMSDFQRIVSNRPMVTVCG